MADRLGRILMGLPPPLQQRLGIKAAFIYIQALIHPKRGSSLLHKHPSCRLIVFLIGVKKTKKITKLPLFVPGKRRQEKVKKNSARVCVFAHPRTVDKRTCSWDLIASFQSRRSHRDAGDRCKVPFGKYDGGAIRQGQGR